MSFTRDSLVRLLQEACNEGATEMHFKVPNALVRRDGRLMHSPLPPLRPSDTYEVVQQLCGLANREIPLATVDSLELTFGLAGVGRFRAVVSRQRGSFAVTIRRPPTTIPALDTLGVDGSVHRLVGLDGLVLVAGPKRRDLLHALLSDYNARTRGHVVVIESALSYLHRDSAAAIVHREIGADVADMTTGVRQAIRSGCDFLVLSDLDRPESVEAALTAAEEQIPVMATVAAPEAQFAHWWLTRQFFGEHRQTVERRLELVARATICAGPRRVAEVLRHDHVLPIAL